MVEKVESIERYMDWTEHNNVVEFLSKLSSQGLSMVKYLANAEQRLRRYQASQ